jgi:hypothetical protein
MAVGEVVNLKFLYKVYKCGIRRRKRTVPSSLSQSSTELSPPSSSSGAVNIESVNNKNDDEYLDPLTREGQWLRHGTGFKSDILDIAQAYADKTDLQVLDDIIKRELSINRPDEKENSKILTPSKTNKAVSTVRSPGPFSGNKDRDKDRDDGGIRSLMPLVHRQRKLLSRSGMKTLVPLTPNTGNKENESRSNANKRWKPPSPSDLRTHSNKKPVGERSAVNTPALAVTLFCSPNADCKSIDDNLTISITTENAGDGGSQPPAERDSDPRIAELPDNNDDDDDTWHETGGNDENEAASCEQSPMGFDAFDFSNV